MIGSYWAASLLAFLPRSWSKDIKVVTWFFYVQQICVLNKDSEKTMIEKAVPSSEVKNILEEIYFEDEKTRSRCRGWLALPSRWFLPVDILFPESEPDCRITLRKRGGECYSNIYEYLSRSLFFSVTNINLSCQNFGYKT